MVQINEVVPSRFRTGDLITIKGFGFSPTFGQNSVAIDGVPEPVASESATEITLLVPAGIAVDTYVSVIVFRNDTLENDGGQAWSKGSLDSVREGTLTVPGQIPGVKEAADSSRVEDVPQAQDYERFVTAIDHLLLDVLGAIGDLFAHDGVGLVPFAVGGAGLQLGANPANPEGLEYAAVVRAQTLSWAREISAPAVVLTAMVANGTATIDTGAIGDHLAPFSGTLYRVIVYFDGAAGDTLDQVRILVNAVMQHDSGTGLGITPGNFYVATIAVAVVGGTDLVILEAKKLGVVGIARLVGHVGIR